MASPAGTVGCYFVKSPKTPVITQGGTAGNDGDPSHGVDGEVLTVLRPSEEKLCFPACKLPNREAHIW